ncbi:hypothetical protein DSO57_1021680 [Entomophthora muscae]|uniref:Uncharacterized protein n=1 Tax=Entomophthora muscae TaxID=34485 RepID=A0ACC2U227_9FUNG|nr:hypothetical protein DSO57_1021680 [Entomophthora muscae]
MIWTTSPDLWGEISSPVHQVGGNASHFLHFVEDFPRRAQDLLVSGEYSVISLTCDDLDQFLSDLDPKVSLGVDPPAFIQLLEKPQPAPCAVPVPQEYSP